MILYCLFSISFVAAAVLTRIAIVYLNHRAVMDTPNHRSSHTIPTPRGGGLGVMPVVFSGWMVVLALIGGIALNNPILAAILCGGALCVLSWCDDISTNGLSPLTRLLAQLVAVAIPLFMLPSSALVLNGMLPMPVDRIITALGWVWFINLFNFMDGINGISGIQAGLNAVGVAIMAALVILNPPLVMVSVVLAGAAFGFLVWNLRLRAVVFLGEVGSVGLGYTLGFTLILLAANGLFWAAVIIPLYYLTDATITLIKRLIRGDKVWEAHRTHFYQQATVPGAWSHMQTVGVLAITDMVLIVCAFYTPRFGALMMIPALFIVGITIALYVHAGKRTQP